MSAVATVDFDKVAQRDLALQKANDVRTANARLLEEIATMPRQQGREFVADLLCDPPENVGAIPVARLLLALRRVGPTKTTEWMRAIGVVTPTRRVRELTVRQRGELAARVVRLSEWERRAV